MQSMNSNRGSKDRGTAELGQDCKHQAQGQGLGEDVLRELLMMIGVAA
jgi:hypothetical protein